MRYTITRRYCPDMYQYLYYIFDNNRIPQNEIKQRIRLGHHEIVRSEKAKNIILNAVKTRCEILQPDGTYRNLQSMRFYIFHGYLRGDLSEWVLQPKSKKQMKRDQEQLIKLLET